MSGNVARIKVANRSGREVSIMSNLFTGTIPTWDAIGGPVFLTVPEKDAAGLIAMVGRVNPACKAEIVSVEKVAGGEDVPPEPIAPSVEAVSGECGGAAEDGPEDDEGEEKPRRRGRPKKVEEAAE